MIAGARAGKDSRIAALIVCYKALFGGHDPHLARGERGVIPLVAQDIRATQVAFGCTPSLLRNPALRAERLDPFLPAAWVEAAILAGRPELPPEDGPPLRGRRGSLGGGADACTLAIVHVGATDGATAVGALERSPNRGGLEADEAAARREPVRRRPTVHIDSF